MCKFEIEEIKLFRNSKIRIPVNYFRLSKKDLNRPVVLCTPTSPILFGILSKFENNKIYIKFEEIEDLVLVHSSDIFFITNG